MALGTHDAINVLTNVFSAIPVTSVRHTLNASMFPVRCVGNIEALGAPHDARCPNAS